MQETQVQSLDGEDPLEKEMLTHSNILAWESPGQRNLVGCSSWDCERTGQDSATKQQQHFLFIWLCWILVAAGGIYFPYQGWNSGLLHWECGVLAPEPPGKVSSVSYVCSKIYPICIYIFFKNNHNNKGINIVLHFIFPFTTFGYYF